MVDKQLIEQNWDSIMKNIMVDKDVTDIARNIWIEPLVFSDCSNNVLTILVPTSSENVNPDIQLEYIKGRYTNCIQDALYSLFDEKIEVQFIVGDQCSRKESVSSNLNPKYRFENFVADSNNNVVYAACRHVAKLPGTEFNPLLIYGGSGLGKTHLMTAIGHYLKENSNKTVLYVTAEQFSDEVIESICADKDRSSINSYIVKLRKKYRDVDVLLMDNIEFIIGKRITQEEFFYILNSRIDSGKAIVMASDRHPCLMKGLDYRFSTRFLSGFLIDIQPPSYKTRVAILRGYANTLNSKVSDEIIDYIAKNIRSNVLEMEGAFNQIHARTKLIPLSENIDLEMAKVILKDIISPDSQL